MGMIRGMVRGYGSRPFMYLYLVPKSQKHQNVANECYLYPAWSIWVSMAVGSILRAMVLVKGVLHAAGCSC